MNSKPEAARLRAEFSSFATRSNRRKVNLRGDEVKPEVISPPLQQTMPWLKVSGYELHHRECPFELSAARIAGCGGGSQAVPRIKVHGSLRYALEASCLSFLGLERSIEIHMTMAGCCTNSIFQSIIQFCLRSAPS